MITKWTDVPLKYIMFARGILDIMRDLKRSSETELSTMSSRIARINIVQLEIKYVAISSP